MTRRWWVTPSGLIIPWIAGGGAMFALHVQHFAFYEDGTESGAVIIGSEDTNITRDNTTDSDLHLRLMGEEVNAAGGDAADDYTIQYQVNGAGGWTTVTATSARCQTDTASDLTDDGATTQRLTGGSGSFIAGIQEEGDGEVTDFEHTLSNFTEHVWALTLIAADNADADTLDFRLQRNASISSITMNVTPRITIDKPGGPTLQDVGDAVKTPTGALTRETQIGAGEATKTPTGDLTRETQIGVGEADKTPVGTLATVKFTPQDVGDAIKTPTGTLTRLTEKPVGAATKTPTGDLTRLTEKPVGAAIKAPTGTLVTAFTQFATVDGAVKTPVGTLLREVSKTVGGAVNVPAGTLLKAFLGTFGQADKSPVGTLGTLFIPGGAPGVRQRGLGRRR